MSAAKAAQLANALSESCENLQVALTQLAAGEVQVESRDALITKPDVALKGYDGPGMLILIECHNGQHWVFTLRASENLPLDGDINASHLQALVDVIREAVCSTLSVAATHALFSQNLAVTIQRAAPPGSLGVVPIVVNGDVTAGRILGPLPKGKLLLPPKHSKPPKPYNTLEEGLEQLPPYAKSLLKINVPLSVTLAATKQPVHSIVSLGPGAIIQFKKACDETLSLEVAGLPVAEGEAVKVGDKFGLWITEIKLPDERFRRVQDLL